MYRMEEHNSEFNETKETVNPKCCIGNSLIYSDEICDKKDLYRKGKSCLRIYDLLQNCQLIPLHYIINNQLDILNQTNTMEKLVSVCNVSNEYINYNNHNPCILQQNIEETCWCEYNTTISQVERYRKCFCYPFSESSINIYKNPNKLSITTDCLCSSFFEKSCFFDNPKYKIKGIVPCLITNTIVLKNRNPICVNTFTYTASPTYITNDFSYEFTILLNILKNHILYLLFGVVAIAMIFKLCLNFSRCIRRRTQKRLLKQREEQEMEEHTIDTIDNKNFYYFDLDIHRVRETITEF